MVEKSWQSLWKNKRLVNLDDIVASSNSVPIQTAPGAMKSTPNNPFALSSQMTPTKPLQANTGAAMVNPFKQQNTGQPNMASLLSSTDTTTPQVRSGGGRGMGRILICCVICSVTLKPLLDARVQIPLWLGASRRKREQKFVVLQA